ncbi:PepSY-associated TM helix domain-containing protein [Aureispira sp. CCB-QB1]|uniref:PepSY-associated TM helix domain-containing protein n=1 Tax=Aureispira sp. CCB-QB1 TaxID=1313421 RepID=UPI0006986B95|nr:PepSY-associated TM helix domain-containing protein [Aureispira sp. CCB-QB1]
MTTLQRKKQAQTLRTFRKVHRLTGALLFVFFFIIAITGVFLGWKKHSAGVLLPKSYKGTSTNLKDWQPIDQLNEIATQILKDSINPKLSNKLSRIDIRQNKGMLKFVYSEHHWEIQLDGTTGTVLNIGKRHSDWIENVHDGSIVDAALGVSKGWFKLFYTTIMGLALLLFTITGFWLWYGPKRMRKEQRKR